MSLLNVLKQVSIAATPIEKMMIGAAGVATFISLLTLNIGQVEAASIGGDSYGYTATDEVGYSFQDISRTGTRILAGTDDVTTSANLGFNFNFYGRDYNNLSLTANGLLTFGGSNYQYSNSSFSTSSPYYNLASIGVLWDDWQFFPGGTDAVYYQTVGDPGNRRFITQWNRAGGFYSSPSTVTFESVLFEGSNDILFSYQDVDSGDYRSFGGSSTVGIRDVNGQLNDRNLQWSYNSAVIRDGQSIRISSTSVPEPSAGLSLLAIGAIGVVSAMKRKQEISQRKKAIA
ncbi:MAG: PEP-CTERM sorting domain-containing protein [Phormidium sp.]